MRPLWQTPSIESVIHHHVSSTRNRSSAKHVHLNSLLRSLICGKMHVGEARKTRRMARTREHSTAEVRRTSWAISSPVGDHAYGWIADDRPAGSLRRRSLLEIESKSELSTFNELPISIAAFHYVGDHLLVCGTPGPNDHRLRTISSDDVAN